MKSVVNPIHRNNRSQTIIRKRKNLDLFEFS
jgi:hypothetical protein